MIRISNYALTIALLQRTTYAVVNNDGLCQGTIAEFNDGPCTFANFKAALDTDCTLENLFVGLTTEEEFAEEIAEICEYDAPTQFVEIQGTYRDDQRYFAGSGHFVDGESWDVDTGGIKRFEENSGAKTLIAFPQYAARIPYNQANEDRLGNNGYPANMNLEKSCELKTVMCCFTDDSKGDGFKDGATTDVCRHDLHDSPESNHIKEGWSIFPGSETDTHCVGFTWKDGEDELIGNMMYDVSLRQTADDTKGYREGVPGAPMCGCVEHMPVVEKASCRTATKKSSITWKFELDVETNDVSASNAVEIEYKDCDNADLAAQWKINNPSNDDAIDEHLVGNGGCAGDIEEYLNEEQILYQGEGPTKYTIPDSMWSDLVVGEGIHFQPPDIDPIKADTAFRALIEADCKENDGVTTRSCIIRRVCPSCRAESHHDIYYKRKSPLPPMGTNSTAGEVYFLGMFMNQWKSYMNNMALGDFELYSSYTDALAGTNAWTYCNYDYKDVGFPRDCGPHGGVWNEWNSYVRHGGYADHHGYYVELPPAP